jgi:hypothetical protein
MHIRLFREKKKGVAASEQYLSAVDLAASALLPCHAGLRAEPLLPTGRCNPQSLGFHLAAIARA